jgi:molecular chaperone GrpE
MTHTEQIDEKEDITNTKNTEKNEENKEIKINKKKKFATVSPDLALKITTLKTELESAKEAESKAKENALLHMAELENFKKRKNQEVDAFKKYASENTIREFISILDNFYIASAHIDATKADDTVKGFLMIQKQIESTLEKLNVQKIESLNKPFDINCHQAIGQEAKDGIESNIVIKEMQSGYKLHDKVIRPAMVILSA